MLNFKIETVITQAKTDSRWSGMASLWADVCIMPVLISLDPSASRIEQMEWIEANRERLAAYDAIPANVHEAMESLCDELKMYCDDDQPDAEWQIVEGFSEDYDLTESQAEFVCENWSTWYY